MLHLDLLKPLPILEEVIYLLYVIKLVLVNMNACLKLKQNITHCLFWKGGNNLQFPTLAQHPIVFGEIITAYFEENYGLFEMMNNIGCFKKKTIASFETARCLFWKRENNLQFPTVAQHPILLGEISLSILKKNMACFNNDE